MRKLSEKESRQLAAGDKVFSKDGTEVLYMGYDPVSYSYVVQFPEKARPSRLLSLYQKPKKP